MKLRNYIIKKSIVVNLFIVLLLTITSCSSHKNEYSHDEPEHFSPNPIVEIHESMNLSVPEAFDKIAMVLSRYDMSLPDGLTKNGKFSSTPVRIKDKMCRAQFLNDAPVSCEFRLYGKLIEKNKNKTYLKMHYKEHCIDQKHISNVCKDSNAEKLLFAIHNDLKQY